MMMKLRDVVERGLLHYDTAAYCLKHPQYLTGMPRAGSQGHHRVFSPEQAFTLAVFTHVFTRGHSMQEAAFVIAYCRKQLRKTDEHSKRDGRCHREDMNEDRMLWIVDEKFVGVDRRALDMQFEAIEWQDIQTQRPAADWPREPWVVLALNLTGFYRAYGR
ncbi:hypothetical protein LCGC14_0965700 [marine sediment metagenome]|uniref:Uncharacterized protein n=1 Tax=marine sediment metagenome TaxID=412755 RepID=A0A0F9NZB8_9ZZZZ